MLESVHTEELDSGMQSVHFVCSLKCIKIYMKKKEKSKNLNCACVTFLIEVIGMAWTS